MTSILFLIDRIYCNIFRCNYLRKKILFQIFLHFRNLDSILTILKKRSPSALMYFWTCGFLKTWLDKCLKSPVWEDPPTSNKINGPKHCWNLNRSTFTIFMYHCEGNSVGKSLSQAYAKSWDILLTHWLPMTSILCLIDTIYCHIFKCNYLRNKRVFLNFFFFFVIFGNLDSILHLFKIKMTLTDDAFFNLRTPKILIR